jgi:2-haloacid dehalogenase
MTGSSTVDLPAVLMFDVMGTVVDMDGSVRRDTRQVLAPVGFDDGRADRLAGAVKADLQQSMEAVIDRSVPWQGHRSLRQQAWQRAAPGLPAEVRASLASVVERVDPWPDSPSALNRLRSRCRVVALSNADPDELTALSAHGGLVWHDVLSAQAAHSYKPDPAVYLRAARDLGLEPDRITMVAAHPWDLRAASAVGLRTAYIRRPDADPPADEDVFDLEVDDLSGLADRFC